MCFKPIMIDSIFSLIHKNCALCSNCFNQMKPQFINFKIDDVDALAIYNYDDTFKQIIYQYKGCYDYELKDIFLQRYLFELSLTYKDYFIVPVPSYELDNKKRGFNHVVEIAKTLNLPILDLLEKVQPFKQANNNKDKRKEIEKYIRLKTDQKLTNKKILIIDDVYTTGSTMSVAIKLIKTLSPKKIKSLVITKTIYDEIYSNP